MKSEERHRRQENELVHYLEIGAEKTRPHLPKILGVIGVALGAMIVMSIWSQRQAAKNRDAWDRYQLAVASADIEYADLFEIASAEENQGSPIQEWAYLAYADRQLRQAAEYYLVDREASLDRLENVWGIYEQLAQGASTRQLRDRAKLGVARVLEIQNKIDEARAAYEQIDGPLAAYAAERVAQLDANQAKATSDWLASAELPSFSLPNMPGTPGARPDFGAQLPASDPASSGVDLDADTLQSLEDVFGGSGDDASQRYGESPTGDAADDAQSADPSDSSDETDDATRTAKDGDQAGSTEKGESGQQPE